MKKAYILQKKKSGSLDSLKPSNMWKACPTTCAGGPIPYLALPGSSCCLGSADTEMTGTAEPRISSK